MSDILQTPVTIPPVDSPVQFDAPQLAFDPEIDRFLWISQARRAFKVSGKGLTAAVLDTGLNTKHVDFAGRILAQANFTSEQGGNPTDATDLDGHGTNVAGLIAANADHIGIAPEANIIPVKVLGKNGGSFDSVEKGLQWVIDNRQTHNITAVCMSLGDTGNYSNDSFGNNTMQQKIALLRSQNVAVVIAAGNDYKKHNSQQGMGYPAIIRQSVSVGAVYDADEGPFSYQSGATAHSSSAGQITPFSQRLHPSVNANTFTDIFAPGAPATSSGINGIHGESTQHGTSQATPVTVGVILLMQEFYQRATGKLPSVNDLLLWLRRGGVPIFDGDNENDNVQHTKKEFIRIDALSALDAVRRHLQKQQLGGAIGVA